MNIGKLKTYALLNKRPGRGVREFGMRLYELGRRPPLRIMALAFGTLLAVVTASNAIALDLHPIGTLVISHPFTENPVPVLSAGFQSFLQPPPHGGGGGSAAGRVRFSLFTLTKRVDATSPILLMTIPNGTRLQHVLIDLFDTAGTTVLTRYELMDVLIMGASVKTMEDDNKQEGNKKVLIEEISFDYTKIKQTVFTSSGPVEGCFDITKNLQC